MVMMAEKTKYALVTTEQILLPDSNDRAPAEDTKILKWKRNIKLGCVAAIFVFVLNFGLLVWTQIRSRNQSHGGVAIIYSGTCVTARRISLWSHLTINILGSILFAACNTCMQCLTAPTRDEIDKAHAKYVWVDVGVNTIRNLKIIPSSRRFTWACLALSSVPLHLL